MARIDASFRVPEDADLNKMLYTYSADIKICKPHPNPKYAGMKFVVIELEDIHANNLHLIVKKLGGQVIHPQIGKRP